MPTDALCTFVVTASNISSFRISHADYVCANQQQFIAGGSLAVARLEDRVGMLKGPIAKEIVRTTLIYPPQRLIVPSAIAGKQGRSGILSRREKGIKSAKASIRYEMILSCASVSILKTNL